MTGTLTITHSDDFLKYNNVPKVVHIEFKIWAKGDKLKEITSPVGYGDAVKNYFPETYYLDPKQVIVVTPDDARIFKHGTPNTGLLNDCPAFLDYAFLNGSQDGNTPALLPSDLSDPEKWKSIVGNLRADESQKNGALHFTSSTPAGGGACSVDLAPSSESKSGYRVKSMTFSPTDGIVYRKMDVVDVIHDKDFGDIGKTFKIYVYTGGFPANGGDDNPPVTWEFAIKSIQLNAPIDDDMLIFDPASVDRIWDGQNKIYITVPR
jgi:hypothetical protein